MAFGFLVNSNRKDWPGLTLNYESFIVEGEAFICLIGAAVPEIEQLN